MVKLIMIIFLMLTFIFPLPGQVKEVEMKKWETWDMVIHLDEYDKTNPFDRDLKYEITSPAGNSLILDGFYNGKNEWIVRFTPNEEGIWKAVPFDEETGPGKPEYEFTVSENDPSRHGSIVLNEDNPQKLYYEDGTPYHMLAFELDWLFALDYGNPDLPKSDHLLDLIRENGFNKVIMNVYAYDRGGKIPNVKEEHDYGSLEHIFPFKGTNTDPDYSALNVGFFRHLDRVIELLNEKNMVAHLMIYVWNKKVNWPEAGSDADNMYFDYVVKRYQAYPNVIWDVSKEALAYGQDDMGYITERVDRLRSLDRHRRLVTVHDYQYCSNFPEKVDIISVQHWGTELHNSMSEIRKRHPSKPVFNIEHGGYESCQYDVFLGNYTDPEVCLARNYLCIFAGIYSTYYWQCSSWNVIIHDPFSEPVTPKPKFAYYKHMSDFLNRYDFDRLQPVEGVSASGFALLDEKNNRYIYFVPGENSAIDIKNLPETGSLEISWFNPYTGEYSKATSREWSNYFRITPGFPGVDNILIIQLR